jgi:hypothetical protein
MWSKPLAADFKAFFVRDFQYAPASDPDNLNYIIDADIDRAIDTAMIHFVTDLFGEDTSINIAFMNLAAYYLVESIKNSSKGLSSSSKFPINSSGAGSVNTSYALPERYAKDPFLSSLTLNGYGQFYLNLLLPMLIGNIGVVPGTTLPV